MHPMLPERPSSHGAPTHSKGRSVPRPTLTFVVSSRPTPGYSSAAGKLRRFGEGDIRGVAAPESANNAGAQTSFIPMLTLGIPGHPTMAMMIGALMVHGIAPGPRVMTDRPGLFWGLIASMWLGNLMLVVLNLPMVGVWVKLLRVPYRLLFPSIIVFCCIGAYTINSKAFDVYVMAFFGMVPFGSLVSGWASDAIGAPATVVAGGLATLAAVGLFAWKLPALREELRPIYIARGILRST